MSSSRENGESSCSSWNYLTNHTHKVEHLKTANIETQDITPEQDIENKLGQVPITLNPNRKMRKESFTQRGDIMSWNDIVHAFDRYIEDKEGTSHILKNLNSGEKLYIPDSHRFTEEYQDKQMAKFYSIENKALENYGSQGLTTVMLTLSASPIDDSGQIMPFTDHLDSIMDSNRGSWRAVRSALDRVLEDYEWNYMRILEPHTPDSGSYYTSGYAHQHVALMINDPSDSLKPEDFSSVMDAHIRNCKTAGKEAHKPENSVSVTPYSEDEGGNIGGYLSAYMGEEIQEDARDSERWFKRFLAGIWASNRRRVGFSNEANEWAREDYKEKYKKSLREDENQGSEYHYFGIEDSDGEEIEVESGNSGSYMTSSPYSSNSFVASVSNIWDNPYG